MLFIFSQLFHLKITPQPYITAKNLFFVSGCTVCQATEPTLHIKRDLHVGLKNILIHGKKIVMRDGKWFFKAS